jgi:hypothetical protein
MASNDGLRGDIESLHLPQKAREGGGEGTLLPRLTIHQQFRREFLSARTHPALPWA